VTSDILISQALAFLVVLVLGGLCWILFGRKNIVLDKVTAAQQLWFDEPDFQPSHWLKRPAHLRKSGSRFFPSTGSVE